MRPPSPGMRKDTIILQAAATGQADRKLFTEPGTELKANVSAPETIPSSIAEQGVVVLRARVMVWTNPDLTDPKGATRKIRKDDDVTWNGRRWTARGPMEPEAKDQAGVPVNYRFDIETVA